MEKININFSENLIPIEVSGYHFDIDPDDFDTHIAIDDFIEKYKGNRLISEEFIGDCKEVIDTVLGVGAYSKLFKKDDLKPYYLILRLAEILNDEFKERSTTDKMRAERKKAEKEIDKITSVAREFSRFSKDFDKMTNKYGMKQYVSNKGRTSNKHKGRK